MWFVRYSVTFERVHSLIFTVSPALYYTTYLPSWSHGPGLISHTVSTICTLQMIYFLTKTTWPGQKISQSVSQSESWQFLQLKKSFKCWKSWKSFKSWHWSEIETFQSLAKAVCGYSAEMGAFLGKLCFILLLMLLLSLLMLLMLSLMLSLLLMMWILCWNGTPPR